MPSGRPVETLFLSAGGFAPLLWERRDTLNKEDKQQLLNSLREKFSRAKGMVITDYKGMTVAEMAELRRQLRGSDVEFRVVKNTLLRIAVRDTALAPAEGSFKGPVGIAIGYGDPVAAAKDVFEFAKKNQKLKVTGGVIENAFYPSEELKAVAALPPRPVMLGILAGALQAPLSQMARLLAASMSNMAYALDALMKKKEGN